MNIEWVQTSFIKSNPDNFNIHTQEDIENTAHLIKNFGWRWPIIVSKQTALVVAGHGRLEAAKLLGMEEVPVMFQDFSGPDEEWAFGIADNASSKWAILDIPKINMEIPNLDPNFDIKLLGIKDFTLDPSEKEQLLVCEACNQKIRRKK